MSLVAEVLIFLVVLQVGRQQLGDYKNLKNGRLVWGVFHKKAGMMIGRSAVGVFVV